MNEKKTLKKEWTTRTLLIISFFIVGIFGSNLFVFSVDEEKEDLTFTELFRKDYKYDFLIPIKYNFKKPITGLGSCIFIHLTKDYKPTAGCIALKEKDFLIMAKLIKKNSKIKIF